ncbi:hypothetical protein EZV62_007711 [Acer yangbiense]|uniref:RanBP2-type domain-containing protein n=1 Tax=Acer yangbiense TaxID=1000413 RepID=A0A5C7ID94_9ROSI|nr:hypothetical protein EZV62_007711 [Acer yangbiense]
MGGATRFLLLLTPSPLLHHRCPSLLRLSRRLPPSLPSLFLHHHHIHHSPLPLNPTTTTSSSTKCSRQLHIRASSLSQSPSPRNSHPWPEFQSLLSNLSSSGYFNRTHGGDEYVAAPDLAEDFVHAANACLSFARDRPNLLGMLPRRDVEILVEYGVPFLFRNADDSVTRMKSFLGNNFLLKALVTDKANTIDLMRFLLSYASNLSTSLVTNNVYHRELVESSVRNLLGELAKLSNITPESNLSGSVQSQFPDRYGQKPSTFGQNIEMKRGDWICSRCSFMNFARNTKCLECEEARPKKQLTGGEWECPQCGFCNYGKNIVCLRCDCKRPGEIPLGSGPGYGNGGNANKVDVNSRVAANEEKAQRWFSKVSQLDSTSDMSSAIADEDFPEIMPLRKGVNRFVISTRKTPLERRLENAQYRRNSGNDGTSEGNDLQMGAADKTLDMKVRHSLDDIIGRSSASSASRNTENQGEPNSKYVPFVQFLMRSFPRPCLCQTNNTNFVPFPPDYFAKTNKQQPDAADLTAKANGETSKSVMPGKSDDSRLAVPDMNAVKGPDPLDMSEEAKAERWFRRVAQIKDISELSQIPDEDFPSIMPMRKGVNRFVVSKRKTPLERRLTSQHPLHNINFLGFFFFPSFNLEFKVPEVLTPIVIFRITRSNMSLNDKLSDIEKQGTGDICPADLIEGSEVYASIRLDNAVSYKASPDATRAQLIAQESGFAIIAQEIHPSLMRYKGGFPRFLPNRKKDSLKSRLTPNSYRILMPVGKIGVTCKVSRYFCSPQWNHMTPAFTDEELKTLARAVVRPLEKIGRPYLFNEEKMIKAHLFPQISACRKRLFDVDTVCDAQARRIKGIVEVSRRVALCQRDAGIAPPEDDSNENGPEDPPEGDDEEGAPDYVPKETHDQEITAYSAEAVGDPEGFGASRTTVRQDDQAGPSSSKGKEKARHSSEPASKPEPAAFSRGTNSPHSAANMPSATFQGAEAAGEHLGVMASETPTPAGPIPTPPGDSGVEMRYPDLDSEDPATDLNSHGRQSGKRKASFSHGRPTPKSPE